MNSNQITLFSELGEPPPPAPLHIPKAPTPEVSIYSTIEAYAFFLRGKQSSQHTVDAYTGDIEYLQSYLGDKPLDTISLQDLRGFHSMMIAKRINASTMHRRIASVKNYFSWLYYVERVLSFNPAELLICDRPGLKLPYILTDDESDRLVQSSTRDPRNYVLVLLLFNIGLKRQELITLKKEDIVIEAFKATLYVRSDNPYKNRPLLLSGDFVAAYRQYIEREKPDDLLFPYTERNLNFILKSLGKSANISSSVSCQVLRDTGAVRRIKSGESPETVLKRLGLAPSEVCREALNKYMILAKKAI